MTTLVHPPDEPQLVARALRAYGGNDIDHWAAEVHQIAGRQYVVLDPSEDRHVIYRVMANGLLRRLIQPPPELLTGDHQ